MLKEALGKLARHSAVYGAAEQLGRMAAFLLMPLHTGYMDKGQYGVWALLGPSIAILTHLLGVNMYNAMTRWYFEREAGPDRRAVVSTTILALAGVAGTSCGLLWIFAEPLASLFPTDYPGMTSLVQLTLGIVVFQMLKEVMFKYLQAEQRSLTYAAFHVSKLVLEISLQVYFLVVQKRGIESIFLAMLIGEGVTAVVLLAMHLPRIGLRFDVPLFLAMAAFTLPLIPNGILQLVLHSADRYMLASIQDAGAAGIYDVAYKLGSIPNYLIMGPFLLIWYPYVFSINTLERQKELCGRLLPYFMLLMTAVVLGVSIAAEDLDAIMVRGESYANAWRGIPWICAGYWFWALFQILQTGFYIQKRTKILPLLTGLAAAVNIAANLILIPRFSYLGAAAATTITFAGLCVICGRKVRHEFPVDWPWRRVFGPALGAVAVLAVSLALPLDAGLVSILARSSLWAAWCLWMWAGGFLDAEERQLAVATARGWWTRRPWAPGGDLGGDPIGEPDNRGEE